MTQVQRAALTSPAVPKGVSLGRLHELDVYVRRNSGSLALVQLGNGSIREFSQPTLFPGQAKPASHAPSGHYEGTVSLRCLRAPGSPNPPHPPAASCNPSAKGGGKSWRTAPANAAVAPQTAPERQEFERRLENQVKEFERLAQYISANGKPGNTLGEQCRRAAESLSSVSQSIALGNRGHLVLPAWQEPLGSPAIKRFRAAATRLLPVVQRQAADTKAVLDYCQKRPAIPPCRADVIAPQRSRYDAHQEALRQLHVILATK